LTVKIWLVGTAYLDSHKKAEISLKWHVFKIDGQTEVCKKIE
jgi:hypothetical protein